MYWLGQWQHITNLVVLFFIVKTDVYIRIEATNFWNVENMIAMQFWPLDDAVLSTPDLIALPFHTALNENAQDARARSFWLLLKRGPNIIK